MLPYELLDDTDALDKVTDAVAWRKWIFGELLEVVSFLAVELVRLEA